MDGKIKDVMSRLKEEVKKSMFYYNLYRMEFSGSRDQHNFCLAIIYYLGNFGTVTGPDENGKIVEEEYINQTPAHLLAEIQ